MNLQEKCEGCGSIVPQDKGSLVPSDGILRFLCRSCAEITKAKEAKKHVKGVSRSASLHFDSPHSLNDMQALIEKSSFGMRSKTTALIILRLLASKHPKAVSKEEIERETGLQRATVRDYLDMLHAKKFVTTSGNMVKLHPDLYSGKQGASMA